VALKTQFHQQENSFKDTVVLKTHHVAKCVTILTVILYVYHLAGPLESLEKILLIL